MKHELQAAFEDAVTRAEKAERERDALADALENIAADGTTYPPGWERFSDKDKLKFPPAITWAAQKARAALAQVRK